MNPSHPLSPPLISEFLLLPDGRVLVQNLTPTMAEMLLQWHPAEETLLARVVKQTPTPAAP